MSISKPLPEPLVEKTGEKIPQQIFRCLPAAKSLGAISPWSTSSGGLDESSTLDIGVATAWLHSLASKNRSQYCGVLSIIEPGTGWGRKVDNGRSQKKSVGKVGILPSSKLTASLPHDFFKNLSLENTNSKWCKTFRKLVSGPEQQMVTFVVMKVGKTLQIPSGISYRSVS